MNGPEKKFAPGSHLMNFTLTAEVYVFPELNLLQSLDGQAVGFVIGERSSLEPEVVIEDLSEDQDDGHLLTRRGRIEAGFDWLIVPTAQLKPAVRPTAHSSVIYDLYMAGVVQIGQDRPGQPGPMPVGNVVGDISHFSLPGGRTLRPQLAWRLSEPERGSVRVLTYQEGVEAGVDCDLTVQATFTPMDRF